jgi:hypothetical protein
MKRGELRRGAAESRPSGAVGWSQRCAVMAATPSDLEAERQRAGRERAAYTDGVRRTYIDAHGGACWRTSGRGHGRAVKQRRC